ncbi:MAG: hypothetical protein ACRD28_08630 [Acidobacteriaceae bacterium]
MFPRKTASKQSAKTLQLLEHYWLCGACAREWTLTMDGEQGVKLIEKRHRHARSAYNHPSAVPAL